MRITILAIYWLCVELTTYADCGPLTSPSCGKKFDCARYKRGILTAENYTLLKDLSYITSQTIEPPEKLGDEETFVNPKSDYRAQMQDVVRGEEDNEGMSVKTYEALLAENYVTGSLVLEPWYHQILDCIFREFDTRPPPPKHRKPTSNLPMRLPWPEFSRVQRAKARLLPYYRMASIVVAFDNFNQLIIHRQWDRMEETSIAVVDFLRTNDIPKTNDEAPKRATEERRESGGYHMVHEFGNNGRPVKHRAGQPRR